MAWERLENTLYESNMKVFLEGLKKNLVWLTYKQITDMYQLKMASSKAHTSIHA